jgi:hypothetical protein
VLPSSGGPLDVYYLGYEPSAWTFLVDRPWQALAVFSANVVAYPNMVPMVFGWPAASIAVVGTAVTVVGLTGMSRERAAFLGRSGVFYVMALLGHPYPVDRYLIPLVPIALVCLVLGLSRLSRRRGMPRVFAFALTALLLACHGLWLARYRAVITHETHGAFGRPLRLEWDGVAETLSWIERETLAEDVIASPHDSIVHAYTGRRGVRSWIHVPETWSGDLQRYLTAAEVAAIVKKEFERLSVAYILVEPPLQDPEGQFGQAVLDELGVGGSEFPLAFSSVNRQIRVYRARTTR